MSFKGNEEEGPSALGVSLCDRHGVLQISVIISIIKGRKRRSGKSELRLSYSSKDNKSMNTCTSQLFNQLNQPTCHPIHV